MHIALWIIGGILSLTALFLVTICLFPENLIRLNKRKRPHESLTLKEKCVGLLAFAGFYAFSYGGIFSLLWFLPSAWGHVVEGEYETYRHGISLALALPFCCMWLSQLELFADLYRAHTKKNSSIKNDEDTV